MSWLRPKLICPMCARKHRRAGVSTVYDETLKQERPTAPCPHCGYDPYEPFAQQRWEEREGERRREVAIAVLAEAGLLGPDDDLEDVIQERRDEAAAALRTAGVVGPDGNIDPRRWRPRDRA
jgi:endogenous inhibitor of DNA gyrase (YacG/DUF329 family)